MDRVNRLTRGHYTLPDIERALRHGDHMYAYAESGELDIIHLKIDAERALELAKPTEIQLTTADLVWTKGYSLIETGRLLGVTPQAVKFNLDLLKVKLKKVLDEWTRLDREELSA